MKTVLCMVGFCLVIATAIFAAAPWSVFGGASAVRSGAGPNPWAFSLVSDLSNLAPGDDFSGIRFVDPADNLTFGGLYELSTDYNVTDDDCFGGSPRFQVRLDLNGNGVSDPADGNIFVYIGPVPNFTGCTPGWQSSGNLIGTLDLRYDLTQVGGVFYDTYANALAMHAGSKVLRVVLVVDSGWGFGDLEQTILVDNVMVNDHKLSARGYRP